jgi:hypothetical protein
LIYSGKGIKKPEPGRDSGVSGSGRSMSVYLIIFSLRTPERESFHTFSGMKKQVEDDFVVFSRFIIQF